MAEKNVNIKITAESKDAEKGISKVTAAVNKMGKSSTLRSVNQLASAVTNSISAFNTLKAAVEGVISTVNECADAYAKQRSAELALETAAKNNPYLNASNVSALKKYASELSKLSGIADEDLLPTMTKLAQAGRTESEIMKIMTAATDVAASGVMGFDQACDALNKTFVGEMGSLKELNPQIAQMTAEQLKAGEAVDAMAKSFAGTAASMGDITGGAERLKNALNSVKELAGSAVAAPVNSIKTMLAELVEELVAPMQRSRELAEQAKAIEDILAKKSDGQALTLAEQAELDAYELKKLRVELDNINDAIKQAGANPSVQAGLVAQRDAKQAAIAAKEIEAANSKYRAERLAGIFASGKSKAQEEDEAAKENASAQDMISAYKQRIAVLKEEIATRRELGEEISALSEKEQVSDAMFSGLTSLVANSGGLITTNNAFFKSERESLFAIYGEMLDELLRMAQEKAAAIESLLAEGAALDDAQVKEGLKELEELNGRIRELGGEPVAIGIEIEEEGADDAQERLEALRAAIEAAMPKPDEWRELSDQLLGFVEGMEELRGKIPEEELAALEERIAAVKEALAAPELEGWQKLEQESRDVYARIAEIEEQAKKAADEGKLDLEKAYLEEVERLNEVAAEKAASAWDEYVREMKEKLSGMVSTISSSISSLMSTVSSACDLLLETSENTLDATLSKLEIAYLSGEMDEEEYNEAVTKAKEEAAREQYKIEMWQWAASILTATANIAQGVTQAIAQGGVAGIVTGALVSAAGAVQLASIIASKPTPPTFSTGGIVGGTSYTGDRVQALLNSGEMVLNAGQQRNLFDSINSGNLGTGDSRGQSNSTQIMVNNSAANIVSAEPQVTESQINLMIDMRVNSSMKKGRYNKALTQAEQSQSGKWYGS